MKFLTPFSLSFILQLGLLSTSLALINISINSIVGLDSKLSEIKKEFKLLKGENAKIPPKLRRFDEINTKEKLSGLFWKYVIVVTIYFTLLVINNFIPELISVKELWILNNNPFQVKLILVDGKELIYSHIIPKISIIGVVILSWLELLLITSIYITFMINLKKFINISNE